jgi:hypothetical protein
MYLDAAGQRHQLVAAWRIQFEHGYRWSWRTVGFRMTIGAMHPPQRIGIGRNVHDLVELSDFGWECERHAGYHWNANSHYAEITDLRQWRVGQRADRSPLFELETDSASEKRIAADAACKLPEPLCVECQEMEANTPRRGEKFRAVVREGAAC